MRQQVAAGIIGGLFLLMVTAGLNSMLDGRLIVALGGATEADVAGIRNTLDQLNIGGRFGAWSGRRVHTAYLAEADGFVIVFSQPGSAWLESGSSPAELERRTRLSSGNGALLPVAKGDYWRVDWQEGSGSIRILWMLVGAE